MLFRIVQYVGAFFWPQDFCLRERKAIGRKLSRNRKLARESNAIKCVCDESANPDRTLLAPPLTCVVTGAGAGQARPYNEGAARASEVYVCSHP